MTDYNILYISTGNYGAPAGRLLPLMQGQFGQVIPLEIRSLDGSIPDLTGYAFTATKRQGSTVTAWVGSIVLSGTPAAAPQAMMTVDEDDTGQDGGGEFFLEGTNGSQVIKTHPVSLTITKDPAVNDTPAAGLVGVTTGQKALLATIGELTGLVKMAGGVASAILIKLDGTAAPGINDDSGDGYTIGSIWVDTTNDNAYIATDVTVGAANWEQINGAGGGASAWGGITGTLSAQADLQSALDGKESAGAAATVQTNLTTHTGATTTVHGIADTSKLLVTDDLGVSVQAHNADLTTIATLTPSNDDVIQRKAGAWTARTVAQYVTDILAGWAAHVVTFLQSASAADARTAIGAGTGNGDVTGPGSSVDNTIPRFDLTTGKIIQAGTNAPTYDDAGRITAKNQTLSETPSFMATPTLAFGDGDTGFYETADDSINIMVAGTRRFFLGAAIDGVYSIGSTGSLGVLLAARDATATIPGLFVRSDPDTGIGYIGSNRMVLISGGLPAFLPVIITGIVGSAQAVIPNGTGDVTLVLSGTFTVSDGAGNVAGGVITATAPSGTFDLFTDGGANVCQLQVAADGSVTVIRTAGARTYSVTLNLTWQ